MIIIGLYNKKTIDRIIGNIAKNKSKEKDFNNFIVYLVELINILIK